MPGAQDRWERLAEPSARSYEAPTQLDSARIADRPERGSLADLRHRLERLPAGHPSSPYNDDLSRKPPVVRLKDLELPLHGNERETNGTAKQYEPDPGVGAAGPAGTATHNGSGGHAAGELATAGWSAAAEPSTAEPFSTADRPSAAEPVSTAESFSTAESSAPPNP